MAGEAADGAIDDVNLGGIEEIGDGRAPSPEAVGACAVAVADGGIADEEDGGEVGIFGAGEAEADLLGACVLRWALGASCAGACCASCTRACGGRGLLGGEGEERDEAGEGGGEERGSG